MAFLTPNNIFSQSQNTPNNTFRTRPFISEYKFIPSPPNTIKNHTKDNAPRSIKSMLTTTDVHMKPINNFLLKEQGVIMGY